MLTLHFAHNSFWTAIERKDLTCSSQLYSYRSFRYSSIQLYLHICWCVSAPEKCIYSKRSSQ